MEKIFTDQMHQTVRLESIPRRIVSLVPSQTELLFDLGLDEEVVGITKFCVYPEVWYRSKTRVGGTKQLKLELIRDLKPDLIIGNKEENTQEDIEALKDIAPIWMSDIYTLDDAYEMISLIGEITDRSAIAENIVSEIKFNFANLEKIEKSKSALYFIWQEPFYVAGRHTFIDAMLSACGFKNFCKEQRYPEWIVEKDQHPDYIFLSSEPFPFKEKHVFELQKLFPKSKVTIVDGEMFSWYGSRMKLAPAYFQKLFRDLSGQ